MRCPLCGGTRIVHVIEAYGDLDNESVMIGRIEKPCPLCTTEAFASIEEAEQILLELDTVLYKAENQAETMNLLAELSDRASRWIHKYSTA